MVSPKLLAGRSSRIYPDSPCSDSAHYRYRKGFEVQAGEHTPTLFLTLKSRAAIPYFNEECRYGAPAPIRKEESMFYRSPFPGDQFAELERRQREMQLAGEYSPRIDGSGAFPALNAGGTPRSVEIYACVLRTSARPRRPARKGRADGLPAALSPRVQPFEGSRHRTGGCRVRPWRAQAAHPQGGACTAARDGDI